MFQQFLNQYNGKFVDYDGAYGNQCFDLVNKWSTTLGYRPFGGLYASGIYSQPQGNYSQIPNSPTAVPQAGDIIVWNNRYGGGFGHTGIATGEGDTNYFVSFDQNYPTGSPSKPVRHSYDGVIGWLRPNNLNVSGDNDMMNQGENEYARANKLHLQVRGRPLDRAIFNQLAGKITWLRYIEILSDDPEADNWQENGKVGAVARRDRWDNQIYTLQKQFADATKVAQELQARLEASDNTTKTLSKKVEDLEKKVGELQSPDTINITRTGFNGLFDKIRGLFK